MAQEANRNAVRVAMFLAGVSTWALARKTGISKYRLDKLLVGQVKTVLDSEVEKICAVIQMEHDAFREVIAKLAASVYVAQALAV